MKDNRIFALYKGDKYLMDGTISEIAEARGCKKETIRFLNSPAYRRRAAKSETESKRKSRGRLALIYLEGKWE
ncbi:MAG: hypothetical protein IKR28_09405 [Selenomonadaceae bacterium]|nr:hypothetical protein [Selenomonadaceae bacterium]